MTDQVLVVGHIFFWLLAGLLILLPVRWAIPFYLVMVQIDFSGPFLSSTSTLGVENGLKVIALPTLLLWRVGWRECKALNWQPLAKSWLFFLSYVALAALWSPFRLSALKMVGYLYAYAVLFLIFTYAWSKRWMTQQLLATIVLVALILSVLQTYVLGNLFGFGGTENRFTTFSDAETFGAFLICFLSLFLFCANHGSLRIVCAVSLSLGIVLTGSRYVFIGMIFLFLIASVFYVVRARAKIGLGLLFRRLSLGLVPTLLLVGLITEFFPENRLNELLYLFRPAGIEEIGTFGFRLAIYQETINQLANRDARQLLFGAGTSSGAEVALKLDPDLYTLANVDGNRTIHNEFLRALYDWGVIGLSLLLVFLVRTFKACVALLRQRKSRGAMAFLGICPTILIGLAFGNVLSEAGFPGGTGFVCVLACAAASRFRLAIDNREENREMRSALAPIRPNLGQDPLGAVQ
jgi:hypothetical protein